MINFGIAYSGKDGKDFSTISPYIEDNFETSVECSKVAQKMKKEGF